MYMYIYYIYIYVYIYLFYILYIYNKYIQYIYIYTYILVFITFIHSDFAWFASIWYIEILNKKQVELLHTKIADNISQSFQEKSIQQNI